MLIIIIASYVHAHLFIFRFAEIILLKPNESVLNKGG